MKSTLSSSADASFEEQYSLAELDEGVHSINASEICDDRRHINIEEKKDCLSLYARDSCGSPRSLTGCTRQQTVRVVIAFGL